MYCHFEESSITPTQTVRHVIQVMNALSKVLKSTLGRSAVALFALAFCLLSISVPASIISQSPILTTSPRIGLDSSVVSSSNWAGYVAASGTTPTKTVTAVYGSWILQGVLPSTGAKYSSQWIGIGGFFKGDSSLIQTGSQSSTSGGKTIYGVWWEILPAAETPISEPAAPNDVIVASVVCISSCTSSPQAWTITLQDVTQGWTFTKTVTYASSLKSAEWIEERPAQCIVLVCKLTALANFGTASYGQDFTSITGTGQATIRGVTGSIGSFHHSEIVMKSGTKVIAQPSSLTTDGTSFTVTWA